MFIKQADLFWGMDKNFVKQVMDLTKKETYEEGAYIFHEGEPADHFFIMLTGRIKLITGTQVHAVYLVNHAGEAFGWSSLIDRDAYSASAECAKPTKLLKISKDEFYKVMEKDPANGLIFFKRLAGMIGNRLLMSYRMNSDETQSLVTASIGTGQMQELPAAL